MFRSYQYQTKDPVLIATMLQLKDIKRERHSPADKRINGLIKSLGSSQLDDLVFICALELEKDEFNRTDIVKILASNLGKINPQPPLYFALNFLKGTEDLDSPLILKARDRVKKLIEIFANQ